MRPASLVLAVALALSHPWCRAATTIHHPGWDIALDGDWTQQPGDDPEQKTAASERLGTSLTTSFMALKTNVDDVERLANRWRELRLDAEKAGAAKFHRTATVIEPVLSAAPGAYVLTYHGHDDQGRQFRFYGVVSPRGVLSLYAESSSSTEARLAADFTHVLAGLALRAAQP